MEITRRNARLVLIGTGSPAQAASFQADVCPSTPVLVDPQLIGYRAAQLKRGLFATYNPRTMFDFVRALLRGFRPGKVEGDGLQLGGMFVIAPGYEVLFSYISKTISDRGRLEEVLAAIDRHTP